MTYDPPGPVQPPEPPEPPAYGQPSELPSYGQPPGPAAYAQPPVPPLPSTPPAYQPPAYQPPVAQPPTYQQPVAAQPPYVGYGQQHAFNAQGYPVASYPGYGAAPGQVPAPPIGGLPISAIIVSSVAFLIGLLPFIGPLLALTGLTLSIFSLRRRRGRVLGIIGIVLASLALLTGLLMTLGFIASVLGG